MVGTHNPNEQIRMASSLPVFVRSNTEKSQTSKLCFLLTLWWFRSFFLVCTSYYFVIYKHYEMILKRQAPLFMTCLDAEIYNHFKIQKKKKNPQKHFLRILKYTTRYWFI